MDGNATTAEQVNKVLRDLGLDLGDVNLDSPSCAPARDVTDSTAPQQVCLTHETAEEEKGQEYSSDLLLPGHSAPRVRRPTAVQPLHMIICTMWANGMTGREIARATGCSEPTVHDVKRRPECQKIIRGLIDTHGGDKIRTMFQTEMARSIEALIELRDGVALPNGTVAHAPAAVRLGAIKEFLDRGEGKSVARIETKAVETFSDPKAEYEALQAQITRNQKLLDTGVRTSTSAIRSGH